MARKLGQGEVRYLRILCQRGISESTGWPWDAMRVLNRLTDLGLIEKLGPRRYKILAEGRQALERGTR